ncbi:group III truncated hemoglobin [Aquabacter sp. CN5-332]|uniref:group III truncated hemoglobin n=1 Tax=Aquabacter sp. CN5-332 TaxID=3156608 RepID=UPI0032B3A917
MHVVRMILGATAVETEATAIDEAEIPHLLRAFYARVRSDPLLGPVFNDAVEDWDDHLRRIGDFWSSVMFASGRYKGNPVAMHLLHADRITPAMFDRWLALWAATTDELLSPAAAEAIQAKALRIAESLKAVIHFTPAR